MKKFIPVAVFIVLIIVVAYFMYASKNKSTPKQETATPSKNVFSSIQDALAKSLSLQCSYTDEQGRKTTAYIKAGAVRADIIGTDSKQQFNNSSVIVKDKKMYIWDVDKKQGMTMELKENQVTPEVTGAQQPTGEQNQPDVMGSLEKYKNDCKVAVVADSLFVVPTDVKFQDLSKMAVPTVVIPTGGQVNQQDVQKMMQQYQQQKPQGTSY